MRKLNKAQFASTEQKRHNTLGFNKIKRQSTHLRLNISYFVHDAFIANSRWQEAQEITIKKNRVSVQETLTGN